MLRLNKTVKYATPGSACFDVEATERVILRPGDIKLVKTGLFITECSPNLKLEIYSRSGLAKKGILVANAPGQVDSDYTKEIGVLLMNFSSDTFHVHPGDRIAQAAPQFVLGVPDSEIINSSRVDGFGSTGV